MLSYLFTKTPLIFFTQNLWRDEAFTFFMASKPVTQILSLTAGDFSPPFYYLVLHFWINMFGSSEVAMRSLSLVFYIATVFVVFEIMVEVFKIKQIRAGLYLLLFAVNPFLTYYAFEARMYMMVTFFVTLSYFALFTKKTKLYILSITLALYTHYFAVFILAAQMLSGIIKFKIPNHKQIANYKQYFKFILPLIFIIPWIIFASFNGLTHDGSFWILKPGTIDFLYIPFVLYSGYERVFGQYFHGKAGYAPIHSDFLNLLLLIILVPILLKSLFFIYKRKHVNDAEQVSHQKLTSIILWAFFPPVTIFLLSLFIQPLFHPRYFIFSSVGFLLFLIYIFEYLFSLKRSKISVLAGALVFAFLIFKTVSYTKWNLKYRSKHGVAKIAKEIKSLMRTGDVAYVTSDLDYHLYQYYINPQSVKIYGKIYGEIPDYVGKVLIPENALVKSFPVSPYRAFLIGWNSYIVRSN